MRLVGSRLHVVYRVRRGLSPGLLFSVMGRASFLLVLVSDLPLRLVRVVFLENEQVTTGWLVEGLQLRQIHPYVWMHSV